MLGFFSFEMIYINDDITHFDLQSALPLLTEQRRSQALAFRHELGQKLCAAAYLLLCDGLREEYGITRPPLLGYTKDGKPYLTDHPGIHFNLSHCQEAAICAISGHPIGIDVERLRSYNEMVARYTMNEEEMRQIISSPHPDIAFISLWTRKEALLKLTGTGIKKDMKEVLTGTGVHFTTVVNQAHGYIYSVAEHCDAPGTQR